MIDGGSGLPSTDTVRIVVADHRRLIGDALAALIGRNKRFIVAASVTDTDVPTAVASEEPDVLVVGCGVDSHDTAKVVRDVRARFEELEIVILADSLEPEFIHLVLEYGVGGVLLTDSGCDEIAACIAQVAEGLAVLPPGWKRIVAAERNDPLESLSQRQMEVLQLLAEGCSNEEIGARLFISLNTVKFHVRSIFGRLGVRNRMAAARMLGNRR